MLVCSLYLRVDVEKEARTRELACVFCVIAAKQSATRFGGCLSGRRPRRQWAHEISAGQEDAQRQNALEWATKGGGVYIY